MPQSPTPSRWIVLLLAAAGVMFFAQSALAVPDCYLGTYLKYNGSFAGCAYNVWDQNAQDRCNGKVHVAPTSGGSCHVCVSWWLVDEVLDPSEWNNFTPKNNFECLAGDGMTWKKQSHNSTYGTDKVGCSGCNAYAGDTPCMYSRPILCINQDGSPNPGLSTGFYNGWAQGHIGLTIPIQGRELTSRAYADSVCAAQFGPGYRMAEFHDGGGGWNWNAYGNVSSFDRFWTYIDDQPANCWNNN